MRGPGSGAVSGVLCEDSGESFGNGLLPANGCELMFSTMLICVGVLLTVSGAVAVGLHRSVATLATRVLRHRPVSIARVVLDGPVRIDGTVAAGDQGTLIAPCSGEAVVWFRLRLRNFAGGGGGEGGGSVWVTVADEQCGTAFRVHDGSGAFAVVNPTGAHCIAKAVRFNELPLGAHDRVRMFLEGRRTDWIADVYEEESLRLGDRVAVTGLARREPDTPKPILYRDGPSSRIVLDTAAGGGELVVVTPDAVRRALGGAYRGGRVAIVVGVAMFVAGLVGRLAGYP